MDKETESKPKASKTEVKQNSEKVVPRILAICFSEESIEGEHPFIKGTHFEKVFVSKPPGQTAKDWLYGHAQASLENLAIQCAKKIAKNGIATSWLSSPEIIRIEQDVSVSGIVLEYEIRNTLKLKDVSAVEVHSFPKNEFLNLITKNLK